jgi:hypothetical protein
MHIYWCASIRCDLRQYAAVGSLLNELARTYRRVHQTDSVLLFSRGLPFLSSVLSLAVQCFSAEENYATGITWLEALAKGLDEPGQRQVAGALRELMEVSLV